MHKCSYAFKHWPQIIVPDDRFLHLKALMYRDRHFGSETLYCDCHLGWLLLWTRANSVHVGNGTRCIYPTHLHGLDFRQLKESQLKCGKLLKLSTVYTVSGHFFIPSTTIYARVFVCSHVFVSEMATLWLCSFIFMPYVQIPEFFRFFGWQFLNLKDKSQRVSVKWFYYLTVKLFTKLVLNYY